MSALRSKKIAQRSRQHDESSPAPARHRSALHRESQTPARQREVAALPPYQPPSCPLTVAARQELDSLRANHDYGKYSRHLQTAKTSLPNTTADIHERLRMRKEQVEKETARRQKDGISDKTEAEVEAEARVEALEAKVVELTDRAEKAMRELVDYSDELAMNDVIMKDISEKIPPPPAPQQSRLRRARINGDEEGDLPDEEEALEEAPEVAGVSTIDLLKQAKEEYIHNYNSKSMRLRYENSDYASFKRSVHEAQHGRDGPPVPHSRTWFTEDGGVAPSGTRRRRTNGNRDESDDDEVVIARASTTLKCPLTLQYFKEPYSNRVCKHTFEKSAILDYHRRQAVQSQAPSQNGRRQQPTGPKTAKCPQTGCNAMLELKDFYDDNHILRQVIRAQKEEAREEDSEEEDRDVATGTQRSRPEEIGSEIDIDSEDEAEERRQDAARVKRERARSRGLKTDQDESGGFAE